MVYGVFVLPMPFNQDDWPNPKLRVLPKEWGSQAPVLWDYFIIPPVKPHLQADWPNPTLRIPPHEWGSTLHIHDPVTLALGQPIKNIINVVLHVTPLRSIEMEVSEQISFNGEI